MPSKLKYAKKNFLTLSGKGNFLSAHSKSNIIMRLATMIYNTYIEAGAQGEGEMLKK